MEGWRRVSCSVEFSGDSHAVQTDIAVEDRDRADSTPAAIWLTERECSDQLLVRDLVGIFAQAPQLSFGEDPWLSHLATLHYCSLSFDEDSLRCQDQVIAQQ